MCSFSSSTSSDFLIVDQLPTRLYRPKRAGCIPLRNNVILPKGTVEREPIIAYTNQPTAKSFIAHLTASIKSTNPSRQNHHGCTPQLHPRAFEPWIPIWRMSGESPPKCRLCLPSSPRLCLQWTAGLRASWLANNWPSQMSRGCVRRLVGIQTRHVCQLCGPEKLS